MEAANSLSAPESCVGPAGFGAVVVATAVLGGDEVRAGGPAAVEATVVVLVVVVLDVDVVDVVLTRAELIRTSSSACRSKTSESRSGEVEGAASSKGRVTGVANSGSLEVPAQTTTTPSTMVATTINARSRLFIVAQFVPVVVAGALRQVMPDSPDVMTDQLIPRSSETQTWSSWPMYTRC